MNTLAKIMAVILLRIVPGICLTLLLVFEGGHAMQPPPSPLNVAQLRLLVLEANLIIVGTVDKVIESENTVEAAINVERILKGKAVGKTISIKETYRTSQASGFRSTDDGGSNKNIVSSIAGPSTYHGNYRQGKRIVVLLERIEGTEKYKPLGSGTYDKHLCEFLIEDNGIKTLYFKFAADVEQYTGCEKRFVDFIKRIIESE